MNPEKSGVSWPVMLVVISGMYGYWAVQGNLISSRPSTPGMYDVPDPIPTPGVKTIHSRMWEDPLAKAYRHWKDHHDPETAETLHLVNDGASVNRSVLEAASRVGPDREPVSNQGDPSPMQKFFQSLAQRNATIVLPVYVPGGPYAEDRERRMRIRYSVVTALAEAGYHMHYNLRMSYVVPKVYVRTLRAWQQREIVVPVKLYRHDGDNPEVLVLWINEADLGLRPLLATHRILNSMFGAAADRNDKLDQPFKVSIVGPNTSDALSKMASESNRIRDALLVQIIDQAYPETIPPNAESDPELNEAKTGIDKIMDLAINGSGLSKADEIAMTAEAAKAAKSYFRTRQLLEATTKLLGDPSNKSLNDEQRIATIAGLQAARDVKDSLSKLADGARADCLEVEEQYGSTLGAKIAGVKIDHPAFVQCRRIDAEFSSHFDRLDAVDKMAETCRQLRGGVAEMLAIDRVMQQAIRTQARIGDDAYDSEKLVKQLLAECDSVQSLNMDNPRGKKNAVDQALQRIEELVGYLVDESGGLTKTTTADEIAGTCQLVRDELKEILDIGPVRQQVTNIQTLIESDNVEAADMAKLAKRLLTECETVLSLQSESHREEASEVSKTLKRIETLSDSMLNESGKIQIIAASDAIQSANWILNAAKEISQKRNVQLFADAEVQAKTTLPHKIIDAAKGWIRAAGGAIVVHDRGLQWRCATYGADDQPIQRMTGFQPLLRIPGIEGPEVGVFSARATKDNIEFVDNHAIDLHRVIGTDSQLASALKQELDLRDANYGRIVLITEQDTAYGRAFPATFRGVFPADFETQVMPVLGGRGCLQCHAARDGSSRISNWLVQGKKPSHELIIPGNAQDSPLYKQLEFVSEQTDGEKMDPDHYVGKSDLKLIGRWINEGARYLSTGREFITYKILRGIDGQLPGDDGAPQTPGEGQQVSAATENPEIIERSPEGRTQYDYLKRLQYRIRSLGNVSAIGVVGSDVYDKLLVLRALKPHFPSCVFFTTDLDSILTHKEQLQHTRNLLIASHYDLSLGSKLQQWTPPFRDSYQTSTFLATRLAIHQDQGERIRWHENEAGEWHSVNAHWFPDEIDGLKQSMAAPSQFAKTWRAAGNEDGRNVDPVLHVVGRRQSHALSAPSGGTVEAALHPVGPSSNGSWHYFFVATIALCFCGTMYSLAMRDRINRSPRLIKSGEFPVVRRMLLRLAAALQRARKFLNRTLTPSKMSQEMEQSLENFRRMARSRATSLENKFNLLIACLVLIGLACLIFFAIRGAWGPESAGFFDGYSTWPRKFVYALIGVFAILASAAAIDQFMFELESNAQKDHAAPKAAARLLQEIHLGKIGILALSTLYCGGLFVYGFLSHGFSWAAILIFVTLVYVTKKYGVPSGSLRPTDGLRGPHRDNLVLHPNLEHIAYIAFCCALGITLIDVSAELFFGESAYGFGWYPPSTSRGEIAQLGDWVGNTYAFVGIALLVSTVLFLDAWCFEFSKHYGKYGVAGCFADKDDQSALAQLSDEKKHQYWSSSGDSTQSRLYWQDRVQTLYLIGKLTAVSAAMRLVLMALLLVMVVAYHPVVSPKPMPLSMLVITTLTLGLFILSHLWLRRHFRELRDDQRSELQMTLWNLRAEAGFLTLERSEPEVHDIADAYLRPESQSLVGENSSGPMAALDDDAAQGELQTQVQTEWTAQASSAARHQKTQRLVDLTLIRNQMDELSDGVFLPWNRSPVGWLLNAGTALALVDIWIRWWTMGL